VSVVKERVSGRGWSRERLTEPRAVGVVGILLAVLGFWLALPPWTIQTNVVPLAFGVAAAAAGIWAVTRGERKAGWWAIALAVVLTLAAVWAQGQDEAALRGVLSTGLIAATLRFATPLAFAAMGGIFSERSGVVNIGLEGMMLMGAFFGIWGAIWSGSWAIGLLVAMVFGGLLASIHAFFSIHLRADQIVSGFAMNFLALGLTGYLFIHIYGLGGTPTGVSRVPDVRLPFLHDVPLVGGFLGPVFGQLNLMIWMMFAVVILSFLVLFKTPLGLRIRSVGEHPKAADTVGISVYRVRYFAVIVSGMLSALGGAYISIGFVGSFGQNMTAGRGFIALAAVIFGKWRPVPAFGACLLFGFATGLAQRLQGSDLLPAAISSVNLLSTLPYILVLAALVGVIGRSVAPAAVGRPYVKQ
jgi:general nucleoside transport system permease protein